MLAERRGRSSHLCAQPRASCSHWIGSHPKIFVLDFQEVPLIDSTAANTLRGFLKKLRRAGTHVYFTGARKNVRRTLIDAGLRRPDVAYAESVESALRQAHDGIVASKV